MNWREAAMGTRERRQRERGERRQEILAAAKSLFWKKGFDGTTMPEIAAAAELAPGTLYLYFPSKDALYVELLLECYDQLIARLKAAAAKHSEPRRQAEALIDGFLGFARECPQCFDIIFFVLQRARGRRPQAWLDQEQFEQLRTREAASRQVAAEVLAGAAGAASTDQLRVTVEAVWSMLAGVVFFWRMDPDKEFNAVAREARRVVLGALFPK
jgi:AcrR family transcriptional regulator